MKVCMIRRHGDVYRLLLRSEGRKGKKKEKKGRR